jgi:hypothetical protein
MRRTVADYVSLARSTRLLLEKVVKARKEQIRVEIVNEGRAALSAHLDALNVRLGKSYMPSVAADFAGAIKGKRTIDSLRDAVNTTLANAKIEANAIADKIQINLTMLRETAKDHAFLFADTAQIVLKENADFILLVDSRIAAHKTAEAAKEEALRERLRQEELARIERERVAAERAAEAKKIADDAAIQAAIQVEQRAKEHATAAAIAAATAAVTQPTGPRLAQLADVQMPLMPHYDEPLRIIPETQPSGPPTLKLGTIAERLGFALSADFLRSLGFEPAGKVGAHGVYHEASFPLICQALVAHIELAQAKRFAA